MVTADDFYAPGWASVWSAVDHLWRNGEPVDVVTVAERLRTIGLLDQIGGYEALLDAQGQAPSINADRYARTVVDAARVRRLQHLLSDVVEAGFDPGADPDDLMDRAKAVLADHRLLPRDMEVPPDLWTIQGWLARPRATDDEHAWVIPGLLRAKWRTMFVAPEGVGKSLLTRAMAIAAGEGKHPFTGRPFGDPVTTLMVDLENPEEVIDHQVGIVYDTMAGLTRAGDTWLWHREAGLNLRSRAHQAQFEAVLAAVRPKLVTLGPLYKAYDNNHDDMEGAALEFTGWLDDVRVRYGFALVLEHHAPKGTAKERHLDPAHSAVWKRWPEFGIKLIPKDVDRSGTPQRLELARFRGDRMPTGWPDELVRGSMGSPPWRGVYPTGTFSPVPSGPF
jgi:replicative DNA helicase